MHAPTCMCTHTLQKHTTKKKSKCWHFPLMLKMDSERRDKHYQLHYLQCTVIGPSWPNCSLVLWTWPMKSIKPSPDFGTPCSGQSVNWNWRIVRDWPSCKKKKKIALTLPQWHSLIGLFIALYFIFMLMLLQWHNLENVHLDLHLFFFLFIDFFGFFF